MTGSRLWRLISVALWLIAVLPIFETSAQTAPQASTGNDIDHEAEYRACMALIDEDAGRAYESGLAWYGLGGGCPARHCVALALLELGQFREAASRLETIASTQEGDGRLQAELLVQAAHGWRLAGEPRRSISRLTAAMGILPVSADLLVDRAAAHMDLEAYETALGDLNDALAIEPSHIDARIFRAVAFRYLDRLDAAEADLATALSVDDARADAFLERGIVRQLLGDLDGARTDWLAALAREPEGPVAEAARARLAAMDLNRQ